MAHEKRDVFFSFPERRQAHGNDIEAEKQILAEQALSHHLAQIAMGRGNDTHIDLLRLETTDGDDLAFLQHAQQSRLRIERHIANLVEKQAAAIGLLEPPLLARHGAGESALLMAEQFAFNQIARHGGHVYRNKRLGAAFAILVQGARDQFLAGTGITGDHDRKVGAHQARQGFVYFLHCRRAADQRQPLVKFEIRLIARVMFGPAALDPGQAPPHRARHLVQVERFGQIFERALLCRAHRGLQRIARTHDDHRQIGALFSDARQNIQGIAIGKHHVGNQQIAHALVDPFPHCRHIAGHLDLVAEPRHGLVQDGANGAVIIGHQYGCETLA